MATQAATRRFEARGREYARFDVGAPSESGGTQHEYESRPRNGNGTGKAERLASFLGWFSIGLGVAEIVAPRRFARWIGAPERPGVVTMVGLREIASGVGILSRRRPAGWLWSRVGGDMMDLALLGASLQSPAAEPRRIAAATAAVAGVTVLDMLASEQISRQAKAAAGTIEDLSELTLRRSVTVMASPEDCYRFWRQFENFPRFMQHVESVEVKDDRRSHWIVIGPANLRFEWDAEIVEERPGQLIAWRTVDCADVQHSGVVRFEPATVGRGTIIRVEIRYEPPGGVAGVLGAVVAKLLGQEPEQKVAEDVRRFKQLIETGEIPTTSGQPTGRRGGRRGS